MAILLEFKYDKRLGLPGYSSHDFGVSMKTEVTDVNEIADESARVYRILQNSVDSQIVHQGFVSNESSELNDSVQRQKAQPKAKSNPDDWNCTARQRGLLMTILDRNNLDPEAVEDLSQEIHGRSMSDLGKMQVSAVIGEVLDRWGKHPKATNGRAGVTL